MSELITANNTLVEVIKCIQVYDTQKLIFDSECIADLKELSYSFDIENRLLFIYYERGDNAENIKSVFHINNAIHFTVFY